MEFSEVIKNRHSVRKYTGQPIDREIIDTILDMTRTAPSSHNSKSSAFMVVDDPDTLAAISEMRNHGSAFVKDAAAAVVVLGDETLSDMWVENACISATFLQLAATSMDLGSCWVQVHGRLRSRDCHSMGTAEEYLRGLLGIQDRYRVLCVISLGYEAE